MPNPHDLTFVAPERRAEVHRRIAVIEHFIQKPGRKAAEVAAANLGIGVAQFYNLVRAWRGSQRPENIASGGSLRRRRPRMTDEQIEVIQDIVDRSPRATAHELADDVIYRLASEAIEYRNSRPCDLGGPTVLEVQTLPTSQRSRETCMTSDSDLVAPTVSRRAGFMACLSGRSFFGSE